PISRAAEGPWLHYKRLLAEPFRRGRELTVAVLGDKALAVTELRPKSGFYDYDAKYTEGMTQHICPADIPDEIAAAAKAMALEGHRALGCRGCSRADFRWDDEQGEAGLYLLEINTQPGMTPLSLVPEQARYCGMSYAELVQKIVEEAL
ncbi:MAG TPA: D-alanine--D-alanine ligase, partial [Allosphingosinicella sp.]